jgi:hypothetical protein
MQTIHFFAGLLLVMAVLCAPTALHACPLCAEAIANAKANGNDEETDHFPEAMNQSIYLMLAVPYSALGIVGFCIYRGVKKNDEFRKARDENNSEPNS